MQASLLMLLFPFEILQHIQGFKTHFLRGFPCPEFPAVYLLR